MTLEQLAVLKKQAEDAFLKEPTMKIIPVVLLDLIDDVELAKECLTPIGDKMFEELKELRWFATEINKHIFPGETDTWDAAFTLYVRLKAEIDELKEKLREKG